MGREKWKRAVRSSGDPAPRVAASFFAAGNNYFTHCGHVASLETAKVPFAVFIFHTRYFRMSFL